MNQHVPSTALPGMPAMPPEAVKNADAPKQGEILSAASPIEAVKKRHEQFLMALPGVSGVAIGLMSSGERAIVVYLADASAKKGVPVQIGGCKIEARVIGAIEAQK